MVRLAHFSVKEYLISKRILESRSAKFSANTVYSNKFIATVCLAYLLHLDQDVHIDKAFLRKYPLSKYASHHWIYHAEIAGGDLDLLDRLCPLFLRADPLIHKNWNSIRALEEDSNDPVSGQERPDDTTRTILFHLASEGALDILRFMLKSGARLTWNVTPSTTWLETQHYKQQPKLVKYQ